MDSSMLMPDHNAHLIMVQSPAVPADPSINIPGSPAVTKWQGDCQVHLQAGVRENVVGSAGGQTRVLVPATTARIPSNLPVTLAENDVLTFRDNQSTTTWTLVVRDQDSWGWGLGQNRYILRQS